MDLRFVFCVISAFVIVSCGGNGKLAYVNINKVFNEFEYNKELQKSFEAVKEERDKQLDSLVKYIQFKYSEISELKNSEIRKNKMLEIEKMDNYFEQKKYEFDEMNKSLAFDYEEKMVLRLNEYIKEFGELKKYDIIFGANKDGNVMYAKTELDITTEFIEFANKKFQDE